MTHARNLLDDFDAAGAALLATGEDAISLRATREDEFNRFVVGVRSSVETCRVPDVYGHGPTPRAALADALAKRSDKDAENAKEAKLRAEFEAFKANRSADRMAA